MEDSVKKQYVTDKKISCQGEGEKIGHPLIFLNMGSDNHVDCPYCGIQFHLKPTKP
jgi:uncharacterized Zn-finger protein